MEEKNVALEAKINNIEAELAQAKLELENSKISDIKSEIELYFAGIEETMDKEDYPFSNIIKEVKLIIDKCLNNNEMGLANSYYQAFKDRFSEVEEVKILLDQKIKSLESIMKIILENSYKKEIDNENEESNCESVE